MAKVKYIEVVSMNSEERDEDGEWVYTVNENPQVLYDETAYAIRLFCEEIGPIELMRFTRGLRNQDLYEKALTTALNINMMIIRACDNPLPLYDRTARITPKGRNVDIFNEWRKKHGSTSY